MRGVRLPQVAGAVLWRAIGVYVIWVGATYLLEGRVNLLQRFDPVGRAAYAVVANILIGIGLSGWLVHRVVESGTAEADQLGFRRGGRAYFRSGAAVGSHRCDP
ncbi:MAG: hypothetical protein HY660_15070 [Armatimonadetes bacterium]|nr:hypothetical protein [Armatimonadota bacterium]